MPVVVLAVVGLGALFLFSRGKAKAAGGGKFCQITEADLKAIDEAVMQGEPTNLYPVPWPGHPVYVLLPGWAYFQARQALRNVPAEGGDVLAVQTVQALMQAGSEPTAAWLQAMASCRGGLQPPAPAPEWVGAAAA